MDCNFIKKRISAILDNELNPVDTAETKEHLKKCENCRLFIEKYKSINDKLLLLEEIEPEKTIKITAEKIKPIFSLFNLNKLIPISAVLVVFFIIFLSSIFITPVIYGNTEIQKQTIKAITKTYLKCVMSPSIGHLSFIEFCDCCCEIIGKCSCSNKNSSMNCKGGN